MTSDRSKYLHARHFLALPYVEGFDWVETIRALETVLYFGSETDDYALISRYASVRNRYVRALALSGIVGRWARIDHLKALIRLALEPEPSEYPGDAERPFGHRFYLQSGLLRLADHGGELADISRASLAHLCCEAARQGDPEGASEWYEALAEITREISSPVRHNTTPDTRGLVAHYAGAWKEYAEALPDHADEIRDVIPPHDL